MAAAPFLATVFCDDVRSEVGNKLSLMGIYGANILLPGFPATLPKLCAVMSLYLPVETTADSVTFLLYRDDEEIGRATASLAEARAAAPEAPDAGEERRLNIQFIAQMTPLQLERPCRLKARAVVDGAAIDGGTVSVERIPAD